MDFDWKNVVKSVAPVIGTALGGPLAGAAVKVIAGAVLGNENASQDEVAAAVAGGLQPEAIAKLREADYAFKTRMRELDIDVLKLNASVEQAYLADVQNARQVNASNVVVMRIGMAVLVTFGVLMAVVLFGCYVLLTGKFEYELDPTITNAVSVLVGTIVGYIANNAQQVVGFLFGSSKGSSDKTEALAKAAQSMGKVNG